MVVYDYSRIHVFVDTIAKNPYERKARRPILRVEGNKEALEQLESGTIMDLVRARYG
jgi:hypothetical protein